MAHVAISRDFIARVEHKIQTMRNAEIKALGEEPKLNLNPESPIVLQAVWGEHLHLRHVIPKKWKNREDMVRLTFNTTTTTINKEGKTEPVTCTFTVKPTNNENFEFPPNQHWHHNFLIPDELLQAPEIKSAVDYGNAQAEIVARWNDVAMKVTKFFQSCKSMKEAVTLWPDCKVYIDSDDIARFEKKVVKSASQESDAAKVLASIDTDELMGAAVVARLSGAV